MTMAKNISKSYRYYGDFSLKEKIISSLQKEQKNRNLHDERLITYWRDIVCDYADKIMPCKISFDGRDEFKKTRKILFCNTIDRQFAVDFIFHKKKLIDMLNFYFGDKNSVFTDIKLKVV